MRLPAWLLRKLPERYRHAVYRHRAARLIDEMDQHRKL